MLETLRWILFGTGIWLGYTAMSEVTFASEPGVGLHCMLPLVVGVLCGLTGIEGLLFGPAPARRSWCVPSEYQVRSAMNKLALAGVALVAFFAYWGDGAAVALMSPRVHRWASAREVFRR
jgi:hypothetical protein